MSSGSPNAGTVCILASAARSVALWGHICQENTISRYPAPRRRDGSRFVCRRDIVLPGFDDFDAAIFAKQRGAFLGPSAIGFHLLRRHGYPEACNVHAQVPWE